MDQQTSTPAEIVLCPIHHVAMTRREKNGRIWYSHWLKASATSDAYWCHGPRPDPNRAAKLCAERRTGMRS